MDLGMMHSLPDVTTVALFRKRLGRVGILEKLFQRFDADLKKQDLQACGGQITDATIVLVPKQRNPRKENEDIKKGKVSEAWQEHPKRLRQKAWMPDGPGRMARVTTDTRTASVLTRSMACPPPCAHPCQFPRQSDAVCLLDAENDDAMVWADAADQSKLVDSFLASP